MLKFLKVKEIMFFFQCMLALDLNWSTIHLSVFAFLLSLFFSPLIHYSVHNYFSLFLLSNNITDYSYLTLYAAWKWHQAIKVQGWLAFCILVYITIHAKWTKFSARNNAGKLRGQHDRSSVNLGGVRYTIWGVNHFPLSICTLYTKAFISWFAQKVKQKIFERFFGEIGLKCVVTS